MSFQSKCLFYNKTVQPPALCPQSVHSIIIEYISQLEGPFHIQSVYCTIRVSLLLVSVRIPTSEYKLHNWSVHYTQGIHSTQRVPTPQWECSLYNQSVHSTFRRSIQPSEGLPYNLSVTSPCECPLHHLSMCTTVGVNTTHSTHSTHRVPTPQ